MQPCLNYKATIKRAHNNSVMEMAENQPPKSFVTLPNELWIKILTFHFPDPFIYVQLSEVSRVFYSVFTSDKMWRCLDPYGWKTNVYAKFTRLMAGLRIDESIHTKLFWMDAKPPSRILRGELAIIPSWFRTPRDNDNLYCFLGYYLYRPEDVYSDPIRALPTEKMLWCVANIRGSSLNFIQKDLWEKKRLVIIALRTAPTLFTQLHSRLRRDRDIVLTALRYTQPEKAPDIVKSWGKKCFKDPEIMLAAVRIDGRLLELASQDLQRDYDLVTAAVAQNGEVIFRLKVEITRALLEVALTTSGQLLKHFEECWQNFELVRLAVSSYPLALDFLPSHWKDNHDIIISAVKSSASSFKLASDRLKDDEQTVLRVVRVQPMALEHVSTRLCDNEQVVLVAITCDGSSLQYASERLRSDPLIVEQSMRVFKGTIPLEFSLVFPTKKTILLGVKQSVMTLNYATDVVSHDLDFAAALIRENPEAFCLLPSLMRANRELALLAVSLNSSLYVHPQLEKFRTDPELAAVAVCDSFELMGHVPLSTFEKALDKIKERLLDAKGQNPFEFRWKATRFLYDYPAKLLLSRPWVSFRNLLCSLVRG